MDGGDTIRRRLALHIQERRDQIPQDILVIPVKPAQKMRFGRFPGAREGSERGGANGTLLVVFEKVGNPVDGGFALQQSQEFDGGFADPKGIGVERLDQERLRRRADRPKLCLGGLPIRLKVGIQSLDRLADTRRNIGSGILRWRDRQEQEYRPRHHRLRLYHARGAHST
ncbi:MAG: hypothetical protein A2Z34_09400 [Planctomycetes bacterium RBG_16_59_8]|nr:MAG: hypothetical protein A2Z34_09400 [Planctomycetes bacterium RBG_16_59_8]